MIPKWIQVSLSLYKRRVFLFSLSLILAISAPLFSSFAFAETTEVSTGEPMTLRELYEVGTLALQEGKYKKALVYFDKVKEINPNIPQLYNLIGMTHLELKESAHDAIAAFESAIRIDPKFAEAYNHLGVIYSTIVLDLDLAQEYFLDAIEADPGFSRAYFGVGWLYLVKKKEPAKAVEYLERAVELTPDFVEAQYYLGVGYIMEGSKHLALRPITALKSLSGGEDYANTLQLMMNQETELIKEKMLA